jgi:aspartate kinase
MKVCKFGGTSMANSQQIKKVCSIVTSDKDRRIVVVSAPGKRFDADIKVTDMLIDCANKYLANDDYESVLYGIIARYAEIAEDLGLNKQIVTDIENNLKTRLSMSYTSTEKFMDCMKAAGEDNAARLIAYYMNSQGIPAKYMNPKEAGLFLNDEYGNARVLPQSFKNLSKLKDIEGIIIFPGFFGYSLSGEVVTFPRGGSDITGSILAAALEVDVYENFTDVDSVFVASPKLIDKPKAISALTYREMRELSYAGFSVLHEETLEPVFQRGIPVNIRNTNNPASPGTMITPTRKINDEIRKENVLNTFNHLLDLGVIPIVNENDTVSVDEIKSLMMFGDNDTLSAVVTRLVKADLLIILSDIDGLYDSNPRENNESHLISVVEDIDDSIRNCAGEAGTRRGTGGMVTKLDAAEIVTNAGADMVIANGSDPAIIQRILNGEELGTLFVRKSQKNLINS